MDSNGFNIAQAAQSYSGLAGIMAGFSFAVLVWLVERLNTRDADTAEDILFIRALVYLGLTFLGNLVVAFFWALISGEAKPESNRSNTLAYLASWMMAMMAPLTLEAMTLVVATAGSAYAVKLFRRIFLVILMIALAFLWTESRGVLQNYSGQPTPPPGLFWLPWFEAGSYGAVGLGFLLSQRAPTQRLSLDSETSFSNFTTILLVALLAGAYTFAQVAVAPTTQQFLPAALLLTNLLWAGMAAWSCAFLPRS